MKISSTIAQININDSNLTFYQNIDLNHFQQFSVKLGLEKGADIQAIFPLIEESSSVLEVGAGYGRAINALLNLGYEGTVHAIDRVPHLVSHMQHQFDGKVKISLQDVRTLSLKSQVEVVLWLWSGIMEMSVQEYCQAFRQIHRLLPERGRLFVEIPYKEVKLIGTATASNTIHLKTQWGTIDAFLPTEEEITLNAQRCGFSTVNQYFYETDTGITRVFYEIFK